MQLRTPPEHRDEEKIEPRCWTESRHEGVQAHNAHLRKEKKRSAGKLRLCINIRVQQKTSDVPSTNTKKNAHPEIWGDVPKVESLDLSIGGIAVELNLKCWFNAALGHGDLAGTIVAFRRRARQAETTLVSQDGRGWSRRLIETAERSFEHLGTGLLLRANRSKLGRGKRRGVRRVSTVDRLATCTQRARRRRETSANKICLTLGQTLQRQHA